MGLRTRKGHTLSLQTVDRMLRTPLYSGWISVSAWSQPVRGNFVPLVSEDVFRRAQLLLSGKAPTSTPHVRNRSDFPLRGVVDAEPVEDHSQGQGRKVATKPTPITGALARNAKKGIFGRKL